MPALTQKFLMLNLDCNGLARGGHPRTVPYSKMSSKGHTKLQIRLSGAKNVEEVGDVPFFVAPRRTDENPKNVFSNEFSNLFEIF